MIVPRMLGDKQHYFKALFWGKTGVGKTELLASGAKHPKIGKIAIFNVEDGTFTIPQKYNNDIVVLDIARDENGKELDVLDSMEKAIDMVLAPNPIPILQGVQTIGIDSVSDFETKVLRQVAESNVEKSKGKRIDSDEFELRDYGISGVKMKRIFSTLRSCNKNVIFLATSKEKTIKEKDQNGKLQDVVVGIMPNLTGGVATALISYMDFSWYLYCDDKTNTRKILTTGSSKVDAKTRRSDIQKAIGNTYVLAQDAENLSKLMDIISPFLGKQTTEVTK